MTLLILHNAVADDADPDERDVLVQVESVRAALQSQGHASTSLPVSLDLDELKRELLDRPPELVFNLVESLGGSDRLAPLAAVLLEALNIPFTGSGADALYLSNSKRLTKQRLAACGLPAPPAIFSDYPPFVRGAIESFRPGRYLLKAEHEHASFAMDDTALIDANSIGALASALAERHRRFDKPFFAEQYLNGREFNVGLLDRGDGTPDVLPVAEIRFDSFAPDKPRIVGYAAKWNEHSAEYQQTPRRFDFPDDDKRLLESLGELAVATWRALNLRGYARVDFRADQTGTPYILEANANPCLSPDAGFAAALSQAGIPYDLAIRRIVASCELRV